MLFTSNRTMRVSIVVALLATAMILLVSSRLSARVQKAKESVLQQDEIVYVPSLNQSKLAYLGYDQTAADVLWVRTLNYFARHLLTDRAYPWLPKFVDQILELDPQFKSVYWWAGSSLLYGRFRTNEFVMEANRYYERALKQFPNDHEAAYRLGMNYHSELQSDDPETHKRFRRKALYYLELAASMPDAPRRIGELVAALNVKYGADELALQYLTDLYLRTKDPTELKKLERRMKALNASVDTEARQRAIEAYKKAWSESLYYTNDSFFGLVQSQGKSVSSSWRTHLRTGGDEQRLEPMREE